MFVLPKPEYDVVQRRRVRIHDGIPGVLVLCDSRLRDRRWQCERRQLGGRAR
jgi:hypothetical protein